MPYPSLLLVVGWPSLSDTSNGRDAHGSENASFVLWLRTDPADVPVHGVAVVGGEI